MLSAALAVAAGTARGATPIAGEPLDDSDFLAPGFIAHFLAPPRLRTGKVQRQAPRALTDPAFCWTAGYVHATPAAGLPRYVPAGRPFPAFSWLSSELAVYPNADAIAATGCNPIGVHDGALVLTADRTPDAVRALLPAGFATAYISGAITSYPFAQTYGYFELRGRIPAGRGLWPAFWLVPADLSWPPECDVMEVLGQDPATLYTTLHSRRFSDGTMHGHATHAADLSAAWHSYGVDWGPAQVRYYLDRRLVFAHPTPPDWHKPFYLIANLAVGGPTSWPGAPDATTRFPARFVIAEIGAWQRRRYANA